VKGVPSDIKEKTMTLQATVITLAVQDLGRAKVFYADGLGCAIDQDYPNFVSFQLGEGSSKLGVYERDFAAADAGVPAEGSGFRGVAIHCIVETREAVDELLGKAAAAGGSIVKKAEAAPWGGYFGYFSDPDGHLWKVATSA
jgi:uncharacterized protein